MTAPIKEAQREQAHGTVVALGSLSATVSVEPSSACQRCAAGRGCGAVFLSADHRRLVEVPVPSGLRLAVGQRVGLTLEPARLLEAAWLAYGIPLLAFLGAVLAAAALLPSPISDGAALVMAAAALAGACWWSRRRLRVAMCPGRFRPSVTAALVRPPFPENG